MKKLTNFWKKAKMNKRQKILTYEAVIGSKLIYALEAIPIPKNYYDRIDAAYLKGLRQIMEYTTTYGQMQAGQSRNNTNEELIKDINKEINKGKRKRTYRKISDRIKDRATYLLGKAIKVVGVDPDDPLAEAVMETPDKWNLPEKGGHRV